MSLYGTDVSQLRALSRRLSSAADQLDSGQRRLSGDLAAARAWQGPSADRFRSDWSSRHVQILRTAAERLRAAAKDAERNATEQEGASAAEGSGGASTVTWTGAALGAVSAGGAVASSYWANAVSDLMSRSGRVLDTAEGFALLQQYGRFAPRGLDGRYIASGSWWRRPFAMVDTRNWQMAPGQSGMGARWAGVAKRLGRVSSVLSFGTSAFQQWRTDAVDPAIAPEARVARAGLKGVAAAGGAKAGATAGLTAGLFIGGFAGPLGAAVGGAVGTIAGAALGSHAFGALADAVIGSGVVDDVARRVTRTVSAPRGP